MLKYCLITSFFITTPATQEKYSLDDIFKISNETNDFVSLCGPISLSRIISIKGKSIQFSKFLSEFENRTDEGVPISEILKVSNKHGEKALAVQIPKKEFNRVPYPSILIVDNGIHCLVYENFDAENKVIHVWDPSGLEVVRIPEKIFLEKWDGEAIIFPGSFSYKTQSFYLAILLVCSMLFLIRLRNSN